LYLNFHFYFIFFFFFVNVSFRISTRSELSARGRLCLYQRRHYLSRFYTTRGKGSVVEKIVMDMEQTALDRVRNRWSITRFICIGLLSMFNGKRETEIKETQSL
jgi:hypothetical protein